MRKARVRLIRSASSRNIDPGMTRTFRAGEECTMVQWDRHPGLPPTTDPWWSDFDIDAAYIVRATDVQVLEVLEERAD